MTAKETYRDKDGTYVWMANKDKRKAYTKVYVPEEDPLDGAQTQYGSKTFIYNKSKDQWSETKDQWTEEQSSVEDRK